MAWPSETLLTGVELPRRRVRVLSAPLSGAHVSTPASSSGTSTSAGQHAAGTRTIVIGGAGRTGRRITARLLQRGGEVRVLSRRLSDRAVPDVEQVRGDLRAFDAGVLAGMTGVVITVEPPYDAAGAEAVMHRGVADVASAAARAGIPVVLVSQIYITRPDAQPQLRDVIAARGRGEQALRDSGASYAIVRPGWLTDDPPSGVRLAQGDVDDGTVSRDTVAEVCVQVLLRPAAHGRTFEVFDAGRGDGGDDVDWPRVLDGLTADRGLAGAH